MVSCRVWVKGQVDAKGSEFDAAVKVFMQERV
jgi:hypothetical protein